MSQILAGTSRSEVLLFKKEKIIWNTDDLHADISRRQMCRIQFYQGDLLI